MTAAHAPSDRRWLILALACVVQMMLVLDISVVNVALPDIRTGLGFGASDLAWVVNAYTLAFGGFLLLGGRAADLLGYRRTFLVGVAWFTAASLLNALASSPEVLVAGRGLQGLGAAFASPAALALVTTTFTAPDERAKALAAWAAVSAGGGAIGLIVGGVLTEVLAWEWIFLVNVPVGAAVVVAAWRAVPATPVRRGAFDLAGAVSVTAGLVALVYAIVSAGEHGWGSARTLGFGALGLALLAAFVAVERRARSPLVRLSILRVRSLAVGNLVMLLLISSNFGMFFFTSLYLQDVHGYGPLQTGLAFLPITIGIIVTAGVAERLVRRIGVRAMGVLGLTIAAIGQALLISLPQDSSYVSGLLVAFVPLSVGIGLAFVALTMLATAGVQAQDAGLASGIYNTAQQVGGALGLAALSAIAAGASGVMGGFHAVYLGSTVLFAAGALLLAVLVRPRHVAQVTEAAAEGATP